MSLFTSFTDLPQSSANRQHAVPAAKQRASREGVKADLSHGQTDSFRLKQDRRSLRNERVRSSDHRSNAADSQRDASQAKSSEAARRKDQEAVESSRTMAERSKVDDQSRADRNSDQRREVKPSMHRQGAPLALGASFPAMPSLEPSSDGLGLADLADLVDAVQETGQLEVHPSVEVDPGAAKLETAPQVIPFSTATLSEGVPPPQPSLIPGDEGFGRSDIPSASPVIGSEPETIDKVEPIHEQTFPGADAKSAGSSDLSTTHLGNPLGIESGSGRSMIESSSTSNLQVDTSSRQLMATNLAEGLAVQAELAERGEQKQLTIQLHPAELGEVRLQVEWEHGRFNARIIASESMATEVINQQKPQLVAVLAEQGLSFDSFEVAYENSDASQFQQGQDDPNSSSPTQWFNLNWQQIQRDPSVSDGLSKGSTRQEINIII